MPDSPGVFTRGYVVFFRDGARVATIDIGVTGPVSFTATVFAGVYDIGLETSADSTLVGLPINQTTRLASEIALTNGQQLDYDVTAVPVAGVVTVGGEPMPDSPGTGSRGNVFFAGRSVGSGISVRLGDTGPATFAVTLFAGTYDILLTTGLSVAGFAPIVGLPQAAVTLVATGVNVRTPVTSLAYDVQVASVSGVLTVNGGGLLPSAPLENSRGSVVFQDPRSQARGALPVAKAGAATFSGLVFAGTYDVTFATTHQDVPTFPSLHTVPLASATVVSGTMTTDYDMPLLSVAGKVTVNGGPLIPTSVDQNPTNAAKMLFIDRADHSTTSCLFSTAGDGTYSGSLFAGTYDVDFIAAFDTTANVFGPLLTSGTETRVANAVKIDSAPTLDFDLSVISVSGTVTSSGAALPDSPMVPFRAQVKFRSRATSLPRSLTIGPSGPGTFSGDLFAGTYDAVLWTSPNTALVGLPALAQASLASRVVVGSTSPPPFAWDVPVVSVGGTVTLGGAVLPDSPSHQTRGNITFHDKLTGMAYPFPLSASGPGSVSGSIFAGSYDVTFDTGLDAGLLVPLSEAVNDLEVGCIAASPCTSDLGDISGAWLLVFRDRYLWQDWSVEWSQTPNAIAGTFFSTAQGRGPLATTRTGNTLQMSTPGGLELDATVADGCSMTGRGVRPDRGTMAFFPPGTASVPFVGLR